MDKKNINNILNNKVNNKLNNKLNNKVNMVYVYNKYIGIGDYIKFYAYALEYCKQRGYNLFHLITDNPMEKYIILKDKQAYIDKNKLKTVCNIDNIEKFTYNNSIDYYIISPASFYKIFDHDFITSKIEDVFIFSEEVIKNAPLGLKDYISIHLRLGDVFMETEERFIISKRDKRKYNEHKIYEEIEKEKNNIIFFCDNNAYRQKIKEKYPHIIITNSRIGHTGMAYVNEKHILDAITDFYIMSQSKKIIAASYSGYSIASSKFKNIPLIKLYEENEKYCK
jgi:hypothetical protein